MLSVSAGRRVTTRRLTAPRHGRYAAQGDERPAPAAAAAGPSGITTTSSAEPATCGWRQLSTRASSCAPRRTLRRLEDRVRRRLGRSDPGPRLSVEDRPHGWAVNLVARIIVGSSTDHRATCALRCAGCTADRRMETGSMAACMGGARCCHPGGCRCRRSGRIQPSLAGGIRHCGGSARSEHRHCERTGAAPVIRCLDEPRR